MTLSERPLSGAVRTVRERHAPDALVLDAASPFETLSEAALDELATLADGYSPHEYDPDWLPADAPALLHRVASGEAPVGAPGDGAVAWTTTTTPPAVIVKPRVEGSPEAFVDLLVAEALVAAGAELPEHFLGLFGDRYADLATAMDTDPATTYQVAAACTTAYRGLHVRPVLADWADDLEHLHEAYVEAGEGIRPRVQGLTEAVASGETGLGDAAELACAAVRHGITPPAPFAALADERYREHGAEYAVAWAERLGTTVG